MSNDKLDVMINKDLGYYTDTNKEQRKTILFNMQIGDIKSIKIKETKG